MKILALLLTLSNLTVHAVQIDVYMANNAPYNGRVAPNIQVHYPNQYRSVEKKIDRAVKNGDTNIQAIDRYSDEMNQAYQAMGRIERVGVTKVPAVVFDHQYVIYGTNNVVKAETIYNSFEANQ